MKMTRNETKNMMEFMLKEMAGNVSTAEEFMELAIESELGEKIFRDCQERTIVEITILKVINAFADSTEFCKKAKELIHFDIKNTDCIKNEQESVLLSVYYNTTPLLACSLARNENIRKDILELYDKYEDVFVEVNSQIKTADTWINAMVPFKDVEAYKKALVMIETIADVESDGKQADLKILTHANYQDSLISDFDVKLLQYRTHSVEISEPIRENIRMEIKNLVLKANKKLYREFRNENRFDIDEHMCSVLSNHKKKGKNNSTMLTVISDIVSIHFLKSFDGKDVFGNLSYEDVNILVLCMMYTLNEFAEKYQRETEKGEIYTKNEKAIIMDFLEELSLGLDISSYSFLFSLEGQHIERYLPDAELSMKDIQLLENAYVKAKEEISFKDYVRPAAYILMLLRTVEAYASGYENLLAQDEKNRYLLHKAEILTRDLESKKKEYAELTNKHALNARLHQEKLEKLQAENEKLKKNLQQERKRAGEHEKELFALREYVYKMNRSEAEEEVVMSLVEKEEAIRKLHIVIVGGHQNWNNKMQAVFPEWKYVAEETKTVSENFFNTAELILIFDTHCNHALYCKVMKVIENSSTEIGYIGSAVNIKKTISNIYDVALQKGLI